MPEIEIKRVRYFDRQFLKQAEFREEQTYHMHMRRRLNYILFEQSGVVLVNGNELTIQTDTETPANKNFTVTAGLAISKDSDMMEGKEIILRENSTKNLDDYGILAGQTAYITVHYQEEETNIPPSEGEVDEPTRVKENAVITAHSTDPTGGSADNDEKYIVLGTIIYNTMVSNNDPDDTGRQLATLNHYLGGAAPATLDSIDIIPGSASIEIGETRQLTARGHFSDGSLRDLGASDGLTWESGEPLSATVVDGLVTGVALDPAVEITASVNSISGTATVSVVEESPTLQSITITSTSSTVTVGNTIQLTATGTFSVGPPQTLSGSEVTWNSDNNSVAIVDSNGIVTGVSTGTTNITATSTEDTTIDDTFTVTVNTATDITSVDPPKDIGGQASGGEVEIHGTNIRDAGIAPTQEAVGTQVRLVKGSTTLPAAFVEARPDDTSGDQVVRINMPDRSSTTWGPQEEVGIELEFGGGIDSEPYKYDD